MFIIIERWYVREMNLDGMEVLKILGPYETRKDALLVKGDNGWRDVYVEKWVSAGNGKGYLISGPATDIPEPKTPKPTWE